MFLLKFDNAEFPICEQDMILFYPLFVSGGEAAFSTDFELPLLPKVLTTFNVDALSSAMGQGEKIPGTMITDNGMTYPIWAYPLKIMYRTKKLKLKITTSVLPELFSRRVCDIAKDYGDIIFNYFENNGSVGFPSPLQKIPYATGYGTTLADAASSVMPSMSAVDFCNEIASRTGVAIDTANLPTDIYITPNVLRCSPWVLNNTFYFNTQSGTWVYSDSVYLHTKKIVITEIYQFDEYFTTKFNGVLSIDYQKKSTSSLRIRRNGVSVYFDDSSSATGAATLSVQQGDEIVVTSTASNYLDTTFCFINFTYKPNEVGVAGEPMNILTTVYDGYTTLTSLLQQDYFSIGYFGCFAQKLIDVLRDIATQAGLVLHWGEDNTLHFVTRDNIKTLREYDLVEREPNSTYFGRKNYLTWPNKDVDGNEIRTLMAEYNTMLLDDEKDIAKMRGAAYTTDTQMGGNNYMQWEQFAGEDHDQFKQGEGYLLGRRVSNPDRLVTAGISGSTLPERKGILTVKAETPEDITGDYYLHFDGVDWLVTERKVGDDGITEFQAIQML